MAKKSVEKRHINNHLLDVITPMGIEFNQSNFWFGELLSKTILITLYPPNVKIGWLSKIANMEGVTCSVHMIPTNSGKLIENINKSMGELDAKIANGGSALSIKRAKQQYDHADKLIEKIDQEQENIFYVTVAIMVTATTKEELDRKVRRVESTIAGSRMKGRSPMFKQEEGLLAVSPYCILPEDIKEIASRNMPVSTIAGSFPFNSSGLNDGKGMIFGNDVSGGIVIVDLWKRGGDRTNSNWTILGSPGMGKSATIKLILTNDYAQGTKIIIIDPEREYKELCENLGGQWINCGGGSGGRINPLQVRSMALDSEDLEDAEDNPFKDEGNGFGDLALHFQTLRTFFKLYLKDLSVVDHALLEETLEELYFKFGINYETNASTIANDKFPLLSDLYHLLNEKAQSTDLTMKRREQYETLALLLRSSSVGADSLLWNGHTTIEAKSDFIVLDTMDLQLSDDSIKRTQYFNVLTWAWQVCSKDREEKVFLAVDEAYLCVDPDVPQALVFLRNFSKRIRKYRGGLGVISHSVVDFLDPSVKRHGQALLDNPCYKLFMGTDGKDLEELSKLMHLTEAEIEMLAKKQRGNGLLVAGSKRLHLNVSISEDELELFGRGGGN